MKTKFRFIEFKPWGDKWKCLNIKDPIVTLGEVEYFAPWREWQFCPNPSTGYTIECLRDIAFFLGQLPK